MLAEFIRKSRILSQILNSAAFFNNLLVTFTFTYSLSLQPCDRLTALQTPTQLYLLPSAPILSPSSPKDPFQLLLTIAVLTFPFSSHRFTLKALPIFFSVVRSYSVLHPTFLCISVSATIPQSVYIDRSF